MTDRPNPDTAPAPRTRTAAALAGAVGLSALGGCTHAPDAFTTGNFHWSASQPIAAAHTGDYHALKDPSIVYHDGRWHLFCTVRGTTRSHAIVYSSFKDFADAATAPQTVLPNHDGYFCAPEVFYFEPQQRWYMICQARQPDWDRMYHASFATTTDISDPTSWTQVEHLDLGKPADARAWLDFWVICDDRRAHLFFTSLDGQLWHTATTLAAFPRGWAEPTVAFKGDFFEASHSYKIKGRAQYVTLIECEHGAGWRYYKAYTADSLDGPWQPLAATKEHTFASMLNVTHEGPRWTDVVSHIELLRAGYDQKLEIDPATTRVLFQGARDADRQGKQYGQIPWKLGLLTPTAATTPDKPRD